jgi:hypothetical protein
MERLLATVGQKRSHHSVKYIDVYICRCIGVIQPNVPTRRPTLRKPAVVPLQWAIDLGDLPSRALKAWLLADGREGVAKDEKSAFELAEEGAFGLPPLPRCDGLCDKEY